MQRPNVRHVQALFSATGLGIVYGGNVYATPEQVVTRIKREDRKRSDFSVTVLD